MVRDDDMSIRKTSEDSGHSQGETATRYSVSCQDYVLFPLVFQLPGCADQLAANFHSSCSD